MNTLAIIPARSGSKGLRDKNIKILAGKPLLAYSIQAAKISGVFEEIMVSTDSKQYAEMAQLYGASVPFLRSSETSSDSSSSWDAVKEVLSCYNKIGRKFDSFCLLQPTSPLRTADDIKEAAVLFEHAKTAVVSVCEVDHSPMWCNHLPEDNSLDGFIKKNDDKQRQLFGKYYRVNGAIYFVKTAAFFEDEYLYRNGSFAYVMSRENSIDIDDELDFRIAEFLLQNQNHT